MATVKTEFLDVWEGQISYNQRVKQQQERSSAEWMESYILGLISECGELLNEMNWKKHRLDSIEDFGPNVAEELADITKFVMSMWQEMGYQPNQVLLELERKSGIMAQRFHQEYVFTPGTKPTVILDVDGCLADFVGGFLGWLRGRQYNLELTRQDITDIHLDIGNGWDSQEYRRAKRDFEKDGGYRHLNPLQLALPFTYYFPHHWNLIVWTARPVNRYKRIWGDTLEWLHEHRIYPNALNFGSDERVFEAKALADSGVPVIAVEDNPTLIRRYLNCRIPTVRVPHSYNEDEILDHHPQLFAPKGAYELDKELGLLIQAAIDQAEKRQLHGKQVQTALP